MQQLLVICCVVLFSCPVLKDLERIAEIMRRNITEKYDNI